MSLPCCYPHSLPVLPPPPTPFSARVCPIASFAAVACCSACCFGAAVCFARLFLLADPFVALCSACLSTSLSLSLLVCLSSLTFAVTCHGHRAVNEYKQANKVRERERERERGTSKAKSKREKGHPARTNKQRKQNPKATGRTASTATEDKAGQTLAEQG